MSRPYRIVSCLEAPGYRYRLDVQTDRPRGPRLLVVQLNPSTANSAKSDATIGKVSIWAHEKGFATVTFVNLFAKRTPHPTELVGSYAILNGRRNDDILRAVILDAHVIVFAWGRVPRVLIPYFRRREALLRALAAGRPVHAVGKRLRDGSPRHGRTWNGSNRNLRLHRWRNA